MNAPAVLRQFFRDPREFPFGRSIALGFLTAFIPAVSLATGAVMIFTSFNIGGSTYEQALPSVSRGNIGEFIGMVIVTPVIETLVLIALMKVLRILQLKYTFRILVSSLLWGAAHGLVAPLWFFAPAWSFAIYSHLYESWYRESLSRGYAAALVPHVLTNAIAVLLEWLV
jgi:hypothetical protein